mmetsp:Transcript_53639/g.68873  ORF Transcript_53639/g.68873 Transcript_53639/m.68873 type:complete len:80 (-) Transcript_53639:960-1199(-)
MAGQWLVFHQRSEGHLPRSSIHSRYIHLKVKVSINCLSSGVEPFFAIPSIIFDSPFTTTIAVKGISPACEALKLWTWTE